MATGDVYVIENIHLAENSKIIGRYFSPKLKK